MVGVGDIDGHRDRQVIDEVVVAVVMPIVS